jgi:hypothetical protein
MKLLKRVGFVLALALSFTTQAWAQQVGVVSVATGSTGAVVATMAAVPGFKNWICGFDVSGIGGTALVSPVTVAGTLTGSLVYQLPALAAASGLVFSKSFTPCLPASAQNTAITVTTTADGTATAVDVQAWGYLTQ